MRGFWSWNLRSFKKYLMKLLQVDKLLSFFIAFQNFDWSQQWLCQIDPYLSSQRFPQNNPGVAFIHICSGSAFYILCRMFHYRISSNFFFSERSLPMFNYASMIKTVNRDKPKRPAHTIALASRSWKGLRWLSYGHRYPIFSNYNAEDFHISEYYNWSLLIQYFWIFYLFIR